MAQRDEDLLRVHEIIARGGRVDLVGIPGSGRTHLLRRLCADLLNEGWQVTQIHGSASLRGMPLAAVACAGLGGSVASPSLAISTAQCLADLMKRSARRQHLIAVDDWDAVDGASQGVIEQAARAASASLALTRRIGQTGSAGDADRAWLGEQMLTVSLPPLRYEDLQDILRAEYGGEIDASTMSRIYGKSEGNVGLALAMVDAAVRESRMIQRDALWVAAAGLWSPMLASAIGRFIAPLPDDEQEAIDILALTGVLDMAIATDIIGESAVDALEQRQLIRLHPSAGGHVIALSPPLIAEHLRRTLPTARRVRLRALIQRRLAGSRPGWTPPGDDPAHIEPSAGFVHIVRERAHAELARSSAAWDRSPSADTALARLRAMIADRAPAAQIERLLAQADGMPGAPAARAELVALGAQHRAHVEGELDEALADLRAAEESAGGYASLLRARGVAIELALRAVPADHERRLAPPRPGQPSEAPEAAATRHGVAALVATTEGRLAASEQHLEQMRRSLGGALDSRGELIDGLNLLGTGRLDAARALAARGADASRGAFDADALRRYGYLSALCDMLRGDYAPIESISEEIFGPGDPPAALQLTQLAMVSISTVVAHRQARSRLARRYSLQLARIAVPDGPLPGMVRRLGDIQQHAGARRNAEAADAAEQIAHGHRRRGYLYSAAFGYALAIELDPSARRHRMLRKRIAAVEGEYFAAHLAYLDALVLQDPEQLLAAAARLDAAGRPGHAIAALQHAALLFEQARAPHGAARAREQARRIEEAQRPGSYDVERYGWRTVRLTSREREVVSLVARGLSNQDIAVRLTLSQRTVESHINHIIAKSGVSARAEFRGLATRLDD